MDRLTMERKQVPVYMKNIYRLTPQPALLKDDVDWDNLTLEDLIECPYCRETDAKDIIDSDEDGYNYVYVHPEGYIYCLHHEGLIKQPIDYCPKCGRHFK